MHTLLSVKKDVPVKRTEGIEGRRAVSTQTQLPADGTAWICCVAGCMAEETGLQR